MAASTRFIELRKRLRELRLHMLPKRFSATGAYSDRELDRARGYRLLAHAEIEAFLEDITFQAARRSVSSWQTSKKVSDSLFCLVAHYHQGFGIEGTDETAPFPASSRLKVKEAVKEVVDVAMLQYRKIHADNHGVREENLYRLVIPIGVRKGDLDPLWVTNLSEFGKRRGEVAHKTVKVQQQLDPKSEFDAVDGLLEGLKNLDKLIGQLSP